MEPIYSLEMLGSLRITWYYNPADCTRHTQCHDYLKPNRARTFENISTQYGSSFVQIIIPITIERGDRVMMKMMAGTGNHLPNMDSDHGVG
jgi:hypothetical protein